ncbi:4-(cytidine 5'-diphospho)-2-C-methyl-D-erythritol kinase [Candidatus Nitrospira bockiana]
MVKALRIDAPAKVNLILRVLDRRADGYHNLWSLLQTVGVEDELYIELHPERTGVVLECDVPGLPTDGRNLIVRAAGLVLERAQLRTGLHIRVVKRIPVSAGLGGGSSDAAATIFALNRLLDLKWSAAEMAEIGQVLGSDVPFFFFAPTAQVRGRGEEVRSMRITGTRWIVLLNPGFPIETRWAYDRLASSRSFVPPIAKGVMSLMNKAETSWDEVIPLMENDFEQALSPTHRVLERMKQVLLGHGAQAALLSGSGASVFGIFGAEADAVDARERIHRAYGWWAAAGPAGTTALACRGVVPSGPLQVG